MIFNAYLFETIAAVAHEDIMSKDDPKPFFTPPPTPAPPEAYHNTEAQPLAPETFERAKWAIRERVGQPIKFDDDVECLPTREPLSPRIPDLCPDEAKDEPHNPETCTDPACDCYPF